MTQFLRLLIQVIALVALTLSMGACSGEEEDATISLPSEPDDPDPITEDPDPVEDTPIGEVENTGFWVNVQSDQYDVLVNNDTAFDTDCFIDVDETSNTNMTCYVDVMEGSLYVQEIQMQYNAPPNLCEIVTISPAWHWNQSVGVGPSKVALLEDESVPDEPVLEECRAHHENEVDGASPVLLGDTNMLSCTTNPETDSPSTVTPPTCVYDKSGSGGNNCCFGSYTLEIYEDADQDGSADTLASSETVDWGGTPGSCLSPYIGDGWEFFSDDGVPVTSIQAVPRDPASDNPVGLNDAITLSANASSHQLNFSTWSNFYTTTGSPHNHDGYYSITTSDLPYAVNPIDDLTGTTVGSDGFTAGRDRWIFDCRDNALEIKHRINVYIREWNTLTDFFLYQTSGGVTYDPDVTGLEGTNCDYDGVFGSQACNDFNDLDDILTNAGGTYDTNDASPGSPPDSTDAALRETYFPNLE